MCENEKGGEWVATNPEILFLAVVKMLNGLFSIYGQQLAKRTIKRALRLSSSPENASGNVSESFAYEFSTFTPLVEHSNYCYYYFHSYGEC